MSSCRTRDIPEGWGGTRLSNSGSWISEGWGGDMNDGSAFLEGWTD